MTMPRPSKTQPAAPPTLHAHAMDNLRFIRATMEGATRFTAVSGWGQVLVGLTAFIAALVAARQSQLGTWLQIWLAEATVAVLVAVVAIVLKGRATGDPVLSRPGRKFALGLLPAVLSGAVLTPVFLRGGLSAELPGLWLLLYGAAVLSGGAFSVPLVPIMGTSFLLLGTAALFSPATWGDAYLALGFGAFNILFGVLIIRRHGG